MIIISEQLEKGVKAGLAAVISRIGSQPAPENCLCCGGSEMISSLPGEGVLGPLQKADFGLDL